MLPIKGDCYITQGYGLTDFAKSAAGRAAYRNFPGGIHPGVDLGTHGQALPAICPVSGRVVRAKPDGGWGNHVEVKCDADGWNRQFCHLSDITVKVGDRVEVGQKVGLVGTTGASTGIHLHYGKRRQTLTGWQYEDPSADFRWADPAPAPIPTPTKKYLKAPNRPAVFAFAAGRKHLVPDWPTAVFLFGGDQAEIQEVPADWLDKVPDGGPFPSLANS